MSRIVIETKLRVDLVLRPRQTRDFAKGRAAQSAFIKDGFMTSSCHRFSVYQLIQVRNSLIHWTLYFSVIYLRDHQAESSLNLTASRLTLSVHSSQKVAQITLLKRFHWVYNTLINPRFKVGMNTGYKVCEYWLLSLRYFYDSPPADSIKFR